MAETPGSDSSGMSQAKAVAATLEVKGPSRSLMMDAWYRLIRNKAAVLGGVIVIVFFFVAMFASVIAPHNPLELSSGNDYLPPAFATINNRSGNPEFLLGTDTLGRDVLSRVLYGARVSMIVGIVPTIIVLILGATIGMLAGYYGGRWDNLLMRITDVIYAFPDLLFFIVVMVALRDSFIGNLWNGLFMLFVAFAIVNWVGVARIVRGQVLSLKNNDFIEAAHCIGAKDSRIMLRHLLPNTLGPIIIIAALNIPGYIITEAILGYLGIGIRPATDPSAFFITSWGALMLEGQTAINAQPWMLLTPAIAVSVVVLAFTFLGDGIRDAFDPRLRGTS
jgi:oligopeptide transport system permease protein